MTLYIVRVHPESGEKPIWYGVFPGPVSELSWLIDEFTDPSSCEYKKTNGGLMFKTKPDEDEKDFIVADFDDETDASEHIWYAMNDEKGWKWVLPR